MIALLIITAYGYVAWELMDSGKWLAAVILVCLLLVHGYIEWLQATTEPKDARTHPRNPKEGQS